MHDLKSDSFKKMTKTLRGDIYVILQRHYNQYGYGLTSKQIKNIYNSEFLAPYAEPLDTTTVGPRLSELKAMGAVLRTVKKTSDDEEADDSANDQEDSQDKSKVIKAKGSFKYYPTDAKLPYESYENKTFILKPEMYPENRYSQKVGGFIIACDQYAELTDMDRSLIFKAFVKPLFEKIETIFLSDYKRGNWSPILNMIDESNLLGTLENLRSEKVAEDIGKGLVPSEGVVLKSVEDLDEDTQSKDDHKE
jgi:hypothetical protein